MQESPVTAITGDSFLPCNSIKRFYLSQVYHLCKTLTILYRESPSSPLPYGLPPPSLAVGTRWSIPLDASPARALSMERVPNGRRFPLFLPSLLWDLLRTFPKVGSFLPWRFEPSKIPFLYFLDGHSRLIENVGLFSLGFAVEKFLAKFQKSSIVAWLCHFLAVLVPII